MKKLSRLTALLLTLMMLVSMLPASALAEAYPLSDYQNALSGVLTYGMIDSAYEYYVDQLKEMGAETRFETLKSWRDGLLGDLFYDKFINYFKTAHAGEGLICTCGEPHAYGTAEHTAADCPWSFINFTLSEQYARIKAMGEEQKAAFEATLDAVTLDALKRVNATAYSYRDVDIRIPEGVFSEDYQLQTEAVEVNAALQSALNAVNAGDGVVSAYDISFEKLSDGTEMQPEDGKTVGLTFNVPENGLYAIYHMVEDGNGGYTAEIVGFDVVDDGQISVDAKSFSIYVVNAVNDTTGTPVTAGDTYPMTVGGKPIIFYNDSWGAGNNAGNTTVDPDKGVWHVTDANGSISYIVSEDNSYNKEGQLRHAPWISVTAKKATPRNDAGAVEDEDRITLTYQYVDGNSVRSETFYIIVNTPDTFYIKDEAAENGCLVPAGLEDKEGVTYTWSRSDDKPIRSEALTENGYVNISLDRGGVTNNREPITYTVTAKDPNGNEYTASYEVLYGMEILNPSFEKPVIPQGHQNARFHNGYPELYWKTTAPGNSPTQLTQDIELIKNGATYYGGVTQADDGNQFAEINAEEFGALYQDLLTTSGATLNWGFSHRARGGTNNNTMYVIIGATKDAQSLTGYNQIFDVLDVADGLNDNQLNDNFLRSLPKEGEGHKVVYVDDPDDSKDVVYYIWRHEGTTDRWEPITGTYTVPSGQYLTRLMLVSHPTSSDATQGNLIDAVKAGEYMSYKVEYYLDDQIDDDNTETSTNTARVYDYVKLKNLQSYLNQGYIITNVTVNNDLSYPGDIQNDGLYITQYGGTKDEDDEDYNIVLKIYLKETAVTVTKKIDIEGWYQLSDAEKEALLKDYSATFGLYDQNNNLVATATAQVSYEDEGLMPSALVEFKDPDGEAFKPDLETVYTIKEDSYSTPAGYTWESTAFTPNDITFKLSSNKPNAEFTCTNTYKIANGSLTIKKTGMSKDENAIFSVSGPGYTGKVVVPNDGSVTLFVTCGDYTITEDGGWTARYTANNGPTQTVTVDADGEVVTFTNKKINEKWLDAESSVKNKFTTQTQTN